MYYLTKIIVTTLLVIAISEISKRSSLVGAVLASVPIISVLAMTWLFIETEDLAKVSALSTSISWLVLPSLVLFLALPLLIKFGLGFYASLITSISITVVAYFAMVSALTYFGIWID